MNLEIENAQLKLQILSLQGHLLQFHHRDAIAHLEALRERVAAEMSPDSQSASGPAPGVDAAPAEEEDRTATRDEKSGIPVQ